MYILLLYIVCFSRKKLVKCLNATATMRQCDFYVSISILILFRKMFHGNCDLAVIALRLNRNRSSILL